MNANPVGEFLDRKARLLGAAKEARVSGGDRVGVEVDELLVLIH
jgi:hypothetical protein